MARRLDPVHKKPAEILADLRDGVREAAITGPASALKFLERTIVSQHSLPNGVKFFGWDLFAEYCYLAEDFARCESAVKNALERWDDAMAEFPNEVKKALPELKFLERGIAVRSEAGDFAGALALCDFAVEHGCGAHYEAKRDSLSWAR
jgi:hypothetical protein